MVDAGLPLDMNDGEIIRSDVPARLDGLQVTVVGSQGCVLQGADSLTLTSGQVGWAGSACLAGAVLGALISGWLADRWGQKRLWPITLGIHVAATLFSGLSVDFPSAGKFYRRRVRLARQAAACSSG